MGHFMRNKILGYNFSQKIGGLLWIHEQQIAGDDAGRIFHGACGEIRDTQDIEFAVRIFDCEITIVKFHGVLGGFKGEPGVLLFAGNSADTNGNIVGAAFQALPVTDSERDKIRRHFRRSGKLQRVFAITRSRRVGNNFAVRNGGVAPIYNCSDVECRFVRRLVE